MIEQHYGQLPNVPHPQAAQPTFPSQPISHSPIPLSLIRLMIHLTASPAVGDLMSRCQRNQRVPDSLPVHCSFLHSYCQRIYFNTNFCYHFCFYCAHFLANCFDLCPIVVPAGDIHSGQKWNSKPGIGIVSLSPSYRTDHILLPIFSQRQQLRQVGQVGKSGFFMLAED